MLAVHVLLDPAANVDDTTGREVDDDPVASRTGSPLVDSAPAAHEALVPSQRGECIPEQSVQLSRHCFVELDRLADLFLRLSGI